MFQNAAIQHAGHDAFYAALRCDAQSIGPLIRALCRANHGGNITIPHKAIAADCIERPSALVKRTGVCNTFWGEDGVICGDNTDVEGVRRAVASLLPSVEGANVLIVGAGGAAAAAACALMDAGAADIAITNRSPDRARALAARLDREGRVMRAIIATDQIAGTDIDLVINASSVGLQEGDALPFDLARLGRVTAALDLVYRRDRSTPFVRQARKLGIAAADGTEMLLGQGAAAYEHWFKQKAPLDVMRNALKEQARAIADSNPKQQR